MTITKDKQSLEEIQSDYQIILDKYGRKIVKSASRNLFLMNGDKILTKDHSIREYLHKVRMYETSIN